MEIVTAFTSDGLKLTGLLSESTTNKKTLILHIHGMAGDPYTNAWYRDFHKLYPQNGYAFLSVNHRGTGSVTMFYKKPNQYPCYGNAFELFEESAIDIKAWVDFVKQLGYLNIYIQAHSLGPSKAVYYVADSSQPDVTGLILISPVDMLGLTILDKDIYTKMLTEATELAGKANGDLLLSDKLYGESYISAKTYLNFFEQNSKCNVFCYTDRAHNWDMVNSVKIPVLGIFGTNDDGITSICDVNKATAIFEDQFRASVYVETKIINGADHSFDGFSGEIVETSLAFMKQIP